MSGYHKKGDSNGSGDDSAPRSARKGSSGGNGHGSGGDRGNHTDIPFRDADPEIGEIPLDDLDTFVVPARDDKGISVPLNIRVPPYMERQIEIVVRSGRFPYLRASDFIRHAIYRHMHFTVGIRQSIPKHILPALDAMLEVCRDEEIRQTVEAAFEKIEIRVRHHSSRGDQAEVIRLLTFIKARIDLVEPSAWQRKFIGQFIERYAGHLNVPRMVQHAPGKTSETRQ